MVSLVPLYSVIVLLCDHRERLEHEVLLGESWCTCVGTMRYRGALLSNTLATSSRPNSCSFLISIPANYHSLFCTAIRQTDIF